MPIHTLDRQAIRNELFRRGWKNDKFGAWLRPLNMTDAQAENDWIEATIVGITCQHEISRAETIRQMREANRPYKERFKQKGTDQ